MGGFKGAMILHWAPRRMRHNPEYRVPLPAKFSVAPTQMRGDESCALYSPGSDAGTAPIFYRSVHHTIAMGFPANGSQNGSPGPGLPIRKIGVPG